MFLAAADSTFKTSLDMEVSAEAKRIMVVALGKLYSSRTQRGGLRLHRSLLLTLVMKSARDMYHAAQATAQSVPSEWEDSAAESEMATEADGPNSDLQDVPSANTSPASPSSPPTTGAPQEEPSREDVSGSPTEQPLRHSAGNKENRCPNSQHSRKRRGKAAVAPDFLPCKKAKLEQQQQQESCAQQVIVSPVLMDYVNCGSELGAPPSPVPLPRAVAAC